MPSDDLFSFKILNACTHFENPNIYIFNCHTAEYELFSGDNSVHVAAFAQGGWHQGGDGGRQRAGASGGLQDEPGDAGGGTGGGVWAFSAGCAEEKAAGGSCWGEGEAARAQARDEAPGEAEEQHVAGRRAT